MEEPLFQLLRDCCLECSQRPSLQSARTLTAIVSQADAAVLLPIQRFVLFPLQRILNACRSDPVG